MSLSIDSVLPVLPVPSCVLCLQWVGIQTTHTEEMCPTAPSIFCQQCHSHGHPASLCPDEWPHWTRPATLEELIPTDVRHQYGIQTATPLLFGEARDDGSLDEQLSRMEREGVRSIRIPNYMDTTPDDKGLTGYDRLGAFMKDRGIDISWNPEHTKVSKEDGKEREIAVKRWCLAKGCAVRIG